MGPKVGIKKEKEKQEVLILSEYGNITEESLAVQAGFGYVANDDLYKAWVADGRNQVWDPDKGCYVQLLVSWSVHPIPIRQEPKSKVTGDNIKALAAAKEDEELQFIDRKAKEGGSKWLGYTAFCVIAVDCLIGIWLLLSSGSLGIPFFGG